MTNRTKTIIKRRNSAKRNRKIKSVTIDLLVATLLGILIAIAIVAGY